MATKETPVSKKRFYEKSKVWQQIRHFLAYHYHCANFFSSHLVRLKLSNLCWHNHFFVQCHHTAFGLCPVWRGPGQSQRQHQRQFASFTLFRHSFATEWGRRQIWEERSQHNACSQLEHIHAVSEHARMEQYCE